MKNLDVNLNLYRNFYYVAKHGGFTKASKYAMISQSSLSNSIKNLEESLGTKLFVRSNSTVHLTKSGEELYQKLESIVNIFNSNTENHEIKIGCLRFIADNYLDIPLKKFKNKNKNIKISVNISNAMDLYQLLRKAEIDLIICRHPNFYKFSSAIAIDKLADVENIFVCSTKFYDENKESFKDENYIYPLILPDSSEKRRIVEQNLIDNKINYKVEIEVPNSNLLTKLILEDLGIGYINKDFAKDFIKNNKMKEVSILNEPLLDNLVIIYNKKTISSDVSDLITILKEVFKK